MRTESIRSWILAVAVGLSPGAVALAQSPAPPVAPPPTAEEDAGAGALPQETGAADETIKAIIAQEMDPSAGTYSSGGRRDPFVSLIKGLQGEGATSRGKKAGLEAFLIQEVALKGVVKTPEGFVAMLLGTDGKSYFPRVGARLFDGQIVAIDQTTVTFRQEVTDPLSPVRTRDVKKSLYPSEEMRQ
jgi:Tfp pilus assembly protein PilP